MLTRHETLHLVEVCVSGVLALLWFGITAVNSKQLTVRTAWPAFALFSLHTLVALALFHNHARDYARLAGAAVESLFVSLLLSALLKVYPMVAFGSSFLLASSLLCYTFAALVPSDDAFQTGVIVIGGILALVSALLYLYAPGRRSFWYSSVFFIAVGYYMVVLAATIYAPGVVGGMSSFSHSLMWCISTLLMLVLVTLLTRFLYVPADFNAVSMRTRRRADAGTATETIDVSADDDRPVNVNAFSDVFDFFEYVIVTGGFAPPPPHKE
jgi:hypothetical protein